MSRSHRLDVSYTTVRSLCLLANTVTTAAHLLVPRCSQSSCSLTLSLFILLLCHAVLTVLAHTHWSHILLQFDSFLSSAEVDRFLELAPPSSFVASKMSPVPSQYADWRTSTSFGCHTCQSDRMLRHVFRRVANITGAAADHFEEPQVCELLAAAAAGFI